MHAYILSKFNLPMGFFASFYSILLLVSGKVSHLLMWMIGKMGRLCLENGENNSYLALWKKKHFFSLKHKIFKLKAKFTCQISANLFELSLNYCIFKLWSVNSRSVFCTFFDLQYLQNCKYLDRKVW